jgi:hypothetical protein
MKLEAVGRVSVGDLALKVGREVDDGDGTEGALLGADTASDTQTLRDESQAGLGRDLDTELATADHRAGLLAFLTTFLRLALVAVYNSDTSKFVRHLAGSSRLEARSWVWCLTVEYN